MLESVKVALRISHDKLDTEILETIDTAKDEMARVGIEPTKIVETDPLISSAIKTFCKYAFSSEPKMQEGFFISWQYQIDCLRKSTDYMVVVVDV